MTSRGFFGAVLAFGLMVPIVGGWPTDPMVNVPLCTAVGNQGGNGPAVVPSIDGGAIVAWRDERFADYDIYAQRVDGQGFVQWTVDGLPVCNLTEIQMNVKGISDGAGGAIFVWSDMRDGEADVYAQRIDVDGQPMWPVGSPSLDGVPVSDSPEHQTFVMIVSDGAGGAIVAWEQGVTPSDLYAQRLNPDGEIQWPTGAPSQNGVVVSVANGVQTNPRMISDGAGGAILAWTDGRDTPNTGYDIYAQHLSASGVALWSGDLPVSVEDRTQRRPEIVDDGAGGAFIAWEDDRASANLWAIWAQHIDASGIVQWIANGIMLNDSSMTSLWNLRGAADGQGGAVFVWLDLRNYATLGRDIYAQRVTAAGAMWTPSGVIICAAEQNQADPAVGSPVRGSVVVSWTDYRDGPIAGDVYAIKIVDGSTFLGPPNGLAVSTADYGQGGSVVGRSGWGDAILVWKDGRNLASGVDVYAQGVFLTAIFDDGFESGDTTAWSNAVP